MKVVTEQNIQQEISKGITLVDCYADWCGPCRMLTPVLEQLSNELHGKANIVKIDIDSAQNFASSVQVTSIPTMILFKEGKEVGRLVGLRDAATIRTFILSADKATLSF
jgi:thioredoxin 1